MLGPPYPLIARAMILSATADLYGSAGTLQAVLAASSRPT